MRKVVLYIAMSLDGFIADNQGNIGWLSGTDVNNQSDYGYSEFASGVDTVVMGYTTYHQVMTELSPGIWPYTGMTTYVLTHKSMPDTKDIRFINQPINDLITTLKQTDGKSIWICGGANVIHQLIEQDIIEEYHLTIMPILLGDGLRLFGGDASEIPLELISVSSENGVIDCIYRKRK